MFSYGDRCLEGKSAAKKKSKSAVVSTDTMGPSNTSRWRQILDCPAAHILCILYISLSSRHTCVSGGRRVRPGKNGDGPNHQ